MEKATAELEEANKRLFALWDSLAPNRGSPSTAPPAPSPIIPPPQPTHHNTHNHNHTTQPNEQRDVEDVGDDASVEEAEEWKREGVNSMERNHSIGKKEGGNGNVSGDDSQKRARDKPMPRCGKTAVPQVRGGKRPNGTAPRNRRKSRK